MTHDQLLAISSGYREFVMAEEEVADGDPDPLYLVRAFANWLTRGASDYSEWASWLAAEFRDQWELWNS